MRKYYRLFFSLLFPGFLVLSGYAVLKAQQKNFFDVQRETLV
jgi:hypothetical protein